MGWWSVVETLSSLLAVPTIRFRNLNRTVNAAPVSKYRGRALYEYEGFPITAVDNLVEIPSDPTDRIIILEKAEQYRPDLTARRYYVTPFLGWLILRANGMSDPFTEYLVGKVIRIPILNRVYGKILRV